MHVARISGAASAFIMLLAVAGARSDESAKKPTTITFADGKLAMTAPKEWEQRKPSNRIIEYEFAVPAAEGDSEAGRFTAGAMGGGVKDNIARWQGQFASGAKSATKTAKVAGYDVHFVDLSGTYVGSPFMKIEPKESYRMLAAIVVTDKLGAHFVRMYGPEKTIAANEKAFQAMVESLKK
jgi:hypothetical protein